MIRRAHLDFETYSEYDITLGAIQYAKHPSTEITLLSYRIEDGPVNLWDRFEEPFPPNALMEILEDDSMELGAHNSGFEEAIFRFVGPKFGIPDIIRPTRWRCTAAKAAALSLPRSLDMVSKVLNIGEEKDKRGHDLIKLFCMPQKVTKNQPLARIYPWDRPEEWQEFKEYCIQDTIVESAIDKDMPELTKTELEVFHFDQAMNFRGIPIDVPTVKRTMILMKEYGDREIKKFKALTGGLRPTQREKVKDWFADNGLKLPNLQAATIDDQIKIHKDKPGVILTALKIRKSMSRSSTAKLVKMVNASDPVDMRCRGTLLYHGATTGRWTGRIIQPQNLPRPTIKNPIKTCLPFLQHGDLSDIEMVYEDPMQVISSCIRSFICAPEGREFIVADYASIEARVVCWLAGQKSALRKYEKSIRAKLDWRAGKISKAEYKRIDIECDPYISMAATVFNKPAALITSDERAVGKTIILGCGFGMGVKTFIQTCHDWRTPVSKEIGKRCVYAYRGAYVMVAKLWDTINTAAIRTVRDGISRKAGEFITFALEGKYLMMILPSGRKLAYPFPKVQKVRTPWGEKVDSVTFIGQIKERFWGRVSTYGGCLTENATQAVARDLMALGMINAQAHPGYDIITSIHDEAVSEVTVGSGTIEEFEDLLAVRPSWGKNIPVVAEGYRSRRYKKG